MFARNHGVNRGGIGSAKGQGCITGLARFVLETLGPQAPQMIDSQISRQSEKPRIEVSLGVKTADLRRDAQPGLLEEVFGLGGLVHQAQQVAIEPVLVTLHQSCERLEVPASKPGHIGVETHSHLHRAGKLAYHTVPYTGHRAKKTHRATPILETDISANQDVKIEVLPNPAFADERVAVRLSGVKPGTKVALRAAVRDDAGQAWESRGIYIATSEGGIDTDAQESIGGTYRGVDAAGLFWSMALGAEGDGPRATFCKNDIGPDRVTIIAEIGEKRIASTTLERRYLGADTKARELSVNTTVGRLYIPPGRERLPVVIVLGGSGGGYDLDKAAVLSRHGFATLALAYFGVPLLPQWLHRVPLEYFQQTMSWLGAKEEIDGSRVGLLGVSRGAELALLIASRFPQVRAVAAYAPSAVAWSSGGRDRATGEAIPCWTWNGEAVPSAPLPLRGFIVRSAIPVGLLRRPVKFRNLFRSALRNRAAVEQAMIPAEEIRGPILLISGGDDCVWPAGPMAETIVARLRSRGFTYNAQHVNYPHAGHSLRYPGMPTTARMARSRGVKFPIAFGGTASADAEAQADAWRRAIAFFQKNL